MKDFDARGLLAARLTCWHRLTGPESDELVALFQAAQPPLPMQTERQPLTDEQIKKATWTSSQALLSFGAENGIAAQGIDERVVAVGRAAIELAKGGMMEERPKQPVTPTPKEQGYVPLSDDGKSVFIDGFGEVPLAYPPMQPAKGGVNASNYQRHRIK